MAWTIRIDEDAEKELDKIDKTWRTRILNELLEIEQLTDPRSRGKRLTGPMSGYWRYRVGDYRIICEIFDNVLIVKVIQVGHRSKVYGGD